MDIEIRRAQPSDYEAFCRTYSDETSYSGTLQLPYPSVELWRKRLAEPSPSDFVLVAMVGAEMAGNAGLHQAHSSPRRAHAMTVGLCVRQDYHGKGVGSALMGALVDLADNWLNVFRLELTVFTDNERAIALYRKFGFEHEGTHRAFALRAGRYADVHAMARLRPKPAPSAA